MCSGARLEVRREGVADVEAIEPVRGGMHTKRIRVAAAVGLAVLAAVLTAAPCRTASLEDVPLHGVNLAGAEYACVEGWGIWDTPTGTMPDDTLDTIADWASGLNAVRLPVNETCWLEPVGDAAGVPANYRGANYQHSVRHVVDGLSARGLYVIVDLHRTAPGTAKSLRPEPMANREHSLDFWRSAASTFAGDSRVLFGAYNEPYGIGWECWRDGGCELRSANDGSTFRAAGVNELIATIRDTGARNTILVGGPRWAEAAGEILRWRPTDPLDNLAVDVHIYDFNKTDTPSEFDAEYAPVAAEYPMLIGETGPGLADATKPERCPHKAIRDDGFSEDTLDWADAHDVGYTAWAWNPWPDDGSSCWALTKDWSGTPTVLWGAAYRGRLM